MQNPFNLRVTAQARTVARIIYDGTRTFPAAERFGLSAQMRRAAISIGSNICEGCGRRGNKELAHYLHIALGSATELQFQVLVALDLDLLSEENASSILDEVIRTKKMLSRLLLTMSAQAP